MPRRLSYTLATSGRSSACGVSRSTSDASVTTDSTGGGVTRAAFGCPCGSLPPFFPGSAPRTIRAHCSLNFPTIAEVTAAAAGRRGN